MNSSECEASEIRTTDEALIDAAVPLLPPLGPALYGAITHLAQAHSLTPTQVKVMLQVGAHGHVTIGEIAYRLHASMPATSEIVDRLVEAGHLIRASDPADRRRVLIAASENSLRILQELNELRRAQVRATLDQLEPAERPMFVRALKALLVGLTTVEGASLSGCHAHPAEGAESRSSETTRGTPVPAAPGSTGTIRSSSSSTGAFPK